ncbi:hypothetical protein R4K92_14960, partial [Brachyspira intermedia]|uniref:hypothetical protein n=1 Tax=Brachyspira intermedia TaxID=84377 RepID=UPI003A0F39C0
QFNIKNDKIALFDFAALNFNSMKLLQKVFNEKKILGLYWMFPLDKKNNFWCKPYQTNKDIDFLKYEILELIVTAPELPIKYIDYNSNFVVVENEYEIIRAEIYKCISKGEIAFSEDLQEIFKTNSIIINYQTIIKLVNNFILYPTNDDLNIFSDIKHGIDEAHTVYEQLIDFSLYNTKNTSYINNNENHLYNLLDFIFSIENQYKYKIIRLLGIKITLKQDNIKYNSIYNLLDFIFSIENQYKYKIIRLLGIKITLKNNKGN